jgi:hypothetical protein
MDNVKSKALFIFVSVAFFSSMDTDCFNKKWMVDDNPDGIVSNKENETVGAMPTTTALQSVLEFVARLEKDLEQPHKDRTIMRYFLSNVNKRSDAVEIFEHVFKNKIIDPNAHFGLRTLLIAMIEEGVGLDCIKVAVKHGADVGRNSYVGPYPIEVAQNQLITCWALLANIPVDGDQVGAEFVKCLIVRKLQKVTSVVEFLEKEKARKEKEESAA